jgi:hypothetical protein
MMLSKAYMSALLFADAYQLDGPLTTDEVKPSPNGAVQVQSIIALDLVDESPAKRDVVLMYCTSTRPIKYSSNRNRLDRGTSNFVTVATALLLRSCDVDFLATSLYIHTLHPKKHIRSIYISAKTACYSTMAATYSYNHFNITFPQEHIVHVEINRPEKMNAFFEE